MLKEFVSKGNGMHFFFHTRLLNNGWIIDTGAFQHMTGNIDFFDAPSTLTKVDQFVKIPNGQRYVVKGIGSIILTAKIKLKGALFIPDFKVNLIAVSKLTHDNNLYLIFNSNTC